VRVERENKNDKYDQYHSKNKLPVLGNAVPERVVSVKLQRGNKHILVILQYRPTFSHINGKLFDETF